MENTTPQLMTDEEFNAQVSNWATRQKSNLRTNATAMGRGKGRNNSYTKKNKDGTEEEIVPLKDSVRTSVHKDVGLVDRVRFSFARHGIYFHYGVGRGYVRSGESVTRGSRLSAEQVNDFRQKGLSRQTISRIKNTKSGEVGREPVDWFDSSIRESMNELADTTQEFYGDKAMKHVLDEVDRLLINKKR